MAKFCGMVGYSKTVETKPGIFQTKIVERKQYGDVTRYTRAWEAGESVNDNLRLNNQISIVSDEYAASNFADIRYVVLGHSRWKVTNVEIQRPRLILTVGGVYNGPTPKNS